MRSRLHRQGFELHWELHSKAAWKGKEKHNIQKCDVIVAVFVDTSDIMEDNEIDA